MIDEPAAFPGIRRLLAEEFADARAANVARLRSVAEEDWHGHANDIRELLEEL